MSGSLAAMPSGAAGCSCLAMLAQISLHAIAPESHHVLDICPEKTSDI